MATRGKSFSVNLSQLDHVMATIKAEQGRSEKLVFRKVSSAVNVVYRVATAKRPMITKAQMKAEGRRIRVSDPNAEAGVPVRTGALQASIQKSVETKGSSVLGRIWTSSPYASFLEFGTSKMAARPFMRPAIALTRDAIKALLRKDENA